MAINFLDGITVDSGNSSAPTIVAAGTRPITLTGGAIGTVAIKGSNGGWATGYLFTGHSGTNRGGFGALGSVDALSYYYIGDAYNDTTMVVQPNAGNVGIGTTSPDSKLEVIGDYKQKAADGNSQGFTLSINSGTDAVSLNNYYNASMIFSTNNSAKMTILGSGNVGIGTTSPAQKLDVAGTIKTTGQIQVTPSTGYGTIEIGGPSGGFIDLKGPSTDDYDLRIISGGSGGSFWTGGYGHVMTLNSSGNVGVGTTVPAQKLTVNGAIMSTGSSNPTLILQDSTHSDITIKGDSGIFSVTNASVGQNITMLYNGNVGIGTTSPSQKLDVSGNINATGTMECTKFIANAGSSFEFDVEGNASFNMRHTVANQSLFFLTAAGTGEIKFGTNNVNSRVVITNTGALKSSVSLAVGSITPSTTTGRIDASNDIVAFSTSDIRLKDNIKTIDKALDKVNSIQGIEFDWIEKEEVHGNSGHDIGVIAQEIEKILPDVVTTRDSGYKAVKYEKIVPLLIEAIKDLSKQVDGLKRLI